MAHKKTLTKAEWDALPEATQKVFTDEKVYIPDGENWKLDAEGVEDTGGLKSALQKERERASEAEKALRAERERFKDVDPAKYAQLVAEAEAKETDDLKSKGKIDEILEKHNQKIAELKKSYEAQLAAKDQELNTFKVDLKLRKAFEEGGVIPDRIEDAVALTKPFIQLGEKDVLKILDKDGATLDISLENYTKEVLKESRPWLYAASGAGGSGAPPSQNGGGSGVSVIKRADWEKLPPPQQNAKLQEVLSGKAQLVD